MRNLLLGIGLIILIGFGGFLYRNAIEHPNQKVPCPLDAEVCPDGTSVTRTGLSCTFPVCPPPNVTLESAGIAYAVPAGFSAVTSPDGASLAAYAETTGTSTQTAEIVIRRYAVTPPATALSTMQQTAVNGASGLPVSATAFTSTVLGTHRYTVVSIEQYEGVIDTAYYLARGTDVLRFDAIDRGVPNWTDPSLSVSTLPAQAALIHLLTTLAGQ